MAAGARVALVSSNIASLTTTCRYDFSEKNGGEVKLRLFEILNSEPKEIRSVAKNITRERALTHTVTYARARASTQAHTDTHARRHTNSHTYRHTDTHICTDTNTHARMHRRASACIDAQKRV